ncbi:MAG: nucleoside-diphosphate kinase [Myxococcota bacterium]|jgi:nucleoside-diphosphate kinase
MAIERTLSIIKPDGVKKGVVGQIVTRFENANLNVVAMKMKTLSRHEAEGFYAVHSERPFFGELCEFMTSGPVVLMILEGENAILKNRELMGATNPKDAAPGTIRADFSDSIGENTAHGSDAPETAHFETNWFFAGTEVNRVVRV